MIIPLLLSTFLSLVPFSLAQDSQSQVPLAANAADLIGTWVSQSQGVITGPAFANPLNFSFNYGNNTGVAYSFSENGYFEEAWYRFTANATNPNCILGVIQWQHGTYIPAANGSITMNPIPSDGRQQVQDTCAAVSNVIQQFNGTVFMSTWEIRTDPVLGQELLLYQFDGTPVQPLYPYASPPIMLPTQTLTANITAGQILSGASVIRTATPVILVGLIGGLVGVFSLLW